jgi:hypothetical protein
VLFPVDLFALASAVDDLLDCIRGMDPVDNPPRNRELVRVRTADGCGEVMRYNEDFDQYVNPNNPRLFCRAASVARWYPVYDEEEPTHEG